MKEFLDETKLEKLEKKKKKIELEYIICLKEYSDYAKKNENFYTISDSFLGYAKEFGEILHFYKYIPAFSFRVEEGKKEKFDEFIKSPDFLEIGNAEKNDLVSITEFEREELESLWNLEMVQAYKAQKYSKGSGITVAVVDTGADYEHSEIEANFLKEKKGYNILEKNNEPYDDHGHGTHCSGIIAGYKTGVAPGVTLFAVKFLDSWGWGTITDAIEAIEWCIEQNVDITSNSWGSSYYSKALELVFDVAWNNGIINIAAAGNSGRKDRHYPSGYKSVIATPAIDENEKRAYFSTISEANEISAPGVKIYSCIPNKRYEKYSGTSMACPHVAGGAAIVKAYTKSKSNKYVRELLKNSAKQLGDGRPNEEYGYGLLQIYKALFM